MSVVFTWVPLAPTSHGAVGGGPGRGCTQLRKPPFFQGAASKPAQEKTLPFLLCQETHVPLPWREMLVLSSKAVCYINIFGKIVWNH